MSETEQGAQRRHAEERRTAPRLEARSTVAHASRRAFGAPQHDAAGDQAHSAALARLLAVAEPVILVTVAEAHGSTPREAGAAMLVTFGASWGTIGGGGLEFHAVDVARGMLARGETARELDMPLGPLLGQCCGGRVRLRLEGATERHVAALACAERRESEAAPVVLVFGCGHTGRALAAALAPLPFRTTVVDDRVEPWSPPAGIGFLRLDDPVEGVAFAPSGTAYVVMTHSHALDYRLAEAALRRGDAAYVGLIGSATKRARFERSFRASGGARDAVAGLTCPIGAGDVDDKRPEVIAALTAAELIRVFAGDRSRLPFPGCLRSKPGGSSRSEAEDRGGGRRHRAEPEQSPGAFVQADRPPPPAPPRKGEGRR